MSTSMYDNGGEVAGSRRMSSGSGSQVGEPSELAVASAGCSATSYIMEDDACDRGLIACAQANGEGAVATAEVHAKAGVRLVRRTCFAASAWFLSNKVHSAPFYCLFFLCWK